MTEEALTLLRVCFAAKFIKRYRISFAAGVSETVVKFSGGCSNCTLRGFADASDFARLNSSPRLLVFFVAGEGIADILCEREDFITGWSRFCND